MKKIILGAVFASILAISGDVMKCSHAVKEYKYWGDRASLYSPIGMKQYKDEAEYLQHAIMKEIVAQCKNILEEKNYNLYVKSIKIYSSRYKDDNVTFDY